ncbi:MAG: DTW domain-containing protein, partial [Spirochaetia bacterium]|nr:DTW domain-containing protein [Spirochaetia bacterium]
PAYSPHLLYPGTPDAPALNLSEGKAPELPEGREMLIVLIDGTWRQARKILHDSPNLRALPRLAFTPTRPSRFLFKRQPKPECLSTIEAVYEILGALEARGYEAPDTPRNTLLEILADLVEWQISYQKKSLNADAALQS